MVDSDGVGEADIPTEVVDGDAGGGGVAVTARASAGPELDITDTVRAGEDEPLPFYRRRPVLVGSIAALLVAVVVGVVLTSRNDDEPAAAPPQTTQASSADQATQAPQTAEELSATTLPLGVAPASVGPIEEDLVLLNLLAQAPSVGAANALACPDGLTKDFRGKDFSGQLLENVDFRCADLRDANFSSSLFRSVSILGATLSDARLHNAVFADGIDTFGVIAAGADFTGAVFNGGRFTNGDFTQSNFSNALFIRTEFHEGVFDQATFRGALLLGAALGFRSAPGIDMTETKIYFSGELAQLDTADWTRATCSDGSAAELYESSCEGVDPVAGTPIPHFEWCPDDVQPLETRPFPGQFLANRVIRCVDLSGLDLTATNWSNSILIGVDFTDANLTAANMSGATLLGVTFSNTTMSEVDATSSSWYSVDVAGVDFADLSFQDETANLTLNYMNLDGRDLRLLATGVLVMNGTRARGANLAGAVIEGSVDVDFNDVDLTGATLQGGWNRSSFVGAIMRDVQMSGTNMIDVDLSDADLTGAVAANVVFTDANLGAALRGRTSRARNGKTRHVRMGRTATRMALGSVMSESGVLRVTYQGRTAYLQYR